VCPAATDGSACRDEPLLDGVPFAYRPPSAFASAARDDASVTPHEFRNARRLAAEILTGVGRPPSALAGARDHSSAGSDRSGSEIARCGRSRRQGEAIARMLTASVLSCQKARTFAVALPWGYFQPHSFHIPKRTPSAMFLGVFSLRGRRRASAAAVSDQETPRVLAMANARMISVS
jgi:hypothetical protein